MKVKQSQNKYILRIDKGEKVIELISDFLQKEKIESGIFFGLGALNRAELATLNQKEKDFNEMILQEDLEIVSMYGNITMMEGKPYIHCHVVLSRTDFTTVGGHLKEGEVGATVEIVIGKIDDSAGRVFNEEVGLNILDL